MYLLPTTSDMIVFTFAYSTRQVWSAPDKEQMLWSQKFVLCCIKDNRGQQPWIDYSLHPQQYSRKRLIKHSVHNSDQTNQSFPNTTHVACLRRVELPVYFILFEVGANLFFYSSPQWIYSDLFHHPQISHVVTTNTEWSTVQWKLLGQLQQNTKSLYSGNGSVLVFITAALQTVISCAVQN